jgi:hypothetical protein
MTPTGISNDALGSVKGHPFYQFVIDSLEDYQRDLGKSLCDCYGVDGAIVFEFGAARI